MLIFIGNMAAPAIFAAFVALTGRYDIAFVIVALVNLASLYWLRGLR